MYEEILIMHEYGFDIDGLTKTQRVAAYEDYIIKYAPKVEKFGNFVIYNKCVKLNQSHTNVSLMSKILIDKSESDWKNPEDLILS